MSVASVSDRPCFQILLKPGPDCNDAIRDLRALLKTALRKWDLRCVSITVVASDEPGQMP